MDTKLEAILDFMPTPLAVFINGKLKHLNNACAQLLGYSQTKEVMGLRSAGHSFEKLYIEKRGAFYSKNGAIINVEASFLPLESQDNDLEIYCLNTPNAAGNILQRGQIKDTANLARSRFMAAMSHEMRTPLNSLVNLSTLLNQTSLNAKQQELLDMAQNSASELLNRVEDVLEYSQIEDAVVANNWAPFNPRETLETCASYAKTKAIEKGLNFNLSIDENIEGAFLGDSEKWLRIIKHLCENAVKYTYSGAIEVSLELNDIDNGLMFTISDTGIGIPQERQDNIFDPFNFDLDPTKRIEGGLSLGLALSKRLSNYLGGTIELSSNIGLGTTITLCVPFEKVEDEEDGEEFPELNILVAEDNKTNQKVISLILNQLGQSASAVDDGAQCVEAAKAQAFDLILMDIHMPIMDGYEATKQLRELGINTPIYALTADYRNEVREVAITAGMDGFLAKPLNIERLYEALTEVARHKLQSQAANTKGEIAA